MAFFWKIDRSLKGYISGQDKKFEPIRFLAKSNLSLTECNQVEKMRQKWTSNVFFSSYENNWKQRTGLTHTAAKGTSVRPNVVVVTWGEADQTDHEQRPTSQFHTSISLM